MMAVAYGTIGGVLVVECQNSKGTTWGYGGYVYVRFRWTLFQVELKLNYLSHKIAEILRKIIHRKYMENDF